MTRESNSAIRLSELHMLGPDTVYRAVRSVADDQRPWLSRAPVCEQLGGHRIIHAGEMVAQHPMEIVRLRQSGSFFLACSAGEGEVLVDGEWQRVGAETACLLPPRYPNAIRAVAGSVWSFCWVRYLEPDDLTPVATSNRPECRAFSSEPVCHAVRGLLASCREGDNPGLQHHWVELIHGYVQAFAGPQHYDERLWKAWETVQGSLKAPWDLETIAQQAHMSSENFRRVCQREYGRSPIKHLAFLRVQRAMGLLQSTDLTVEAVGFAVGYQSLAAFSRSFRKWTGASPSALR